MVMARAASVTRPNSLLGVEPDSGEILIIAFQTQSISAASFAVANVPLYDARCDRPA